MPDSSWSEHLHARLASLSLSPAREAEIIDELSQHLDECYEELRAGGASDLEARRVVIEELLDRDALAEQMRSLRRPRDFCSTASGRTCGTRRARCASNLASPLPRS